MAEILAPVTEEALEDILIKLGLDTLDDFLKTIFNYDEETGTFQTADGVGEQLQTLTETVNHPFLTTPISEYTVTEGLLLLIALLAFLSACVRIIREGFFWL